jgi:hypothetical protein
MSTSIQLNRSCGRYGASSGPENDHNSRRTKERFSQSGHSDNNSRSTHDVGQVKELHPLVG